MIESRKSILPLILQYSSILRNSHISVGGRIFFVGDYNELEEGMPIAVMTFQRDALERKRNANSFGDR